MINSGDEQKPEQLQRNSGDEPRSGTVSEEVMLQLSLQKDIFSSPTRRQQILHI